MLQVGVTYVADRGYFAYYLLNDIVAASAFFVIRAPSNVTYDILEALHVNTPNGLSWLLDVHDLKVKCHKGEDSGTWRVVKFVIGQSQFVLFTNRWELSTWQIIVIYAYRWQIELFFFFLKRTLKGLHLLTHSYEGLQIQFYLMLVSALLLLHFKQRNESQTQEKVPDSEPVQVPPDQGKTPVGQSGKDANKVAESVPELGKEPPDGKNVVAKPQQQQKKDGEPTARASDPSSDQTQKPRQGLENPEKGEQKGKQGEEVKVEQTTKAEAAPGNTVQGKPKPSLETSKPSGPSARQGTIQDEDNAVWYHDLGRKLASFWRISIHWLLVLRDNLARPWRPAAFADLPGLDRPRI